MEPGHWERLHDDEAWHDVKHTNSYALFMAYLSMAIKGLGFLVLIWTSFIILGGYVSMLQKDFWCLVFVTLIQTAGIFDAGMDQKLSYVRNALYGLMLGIILGIPGDWRASVEWVLVLVLAATAWVLVVVLPAVAWVLVVVIAIIYELGIVMSGGISLWRLIEHHYSNSGLGGKASNLLPTMYTMYCLAVLQAVLFCYRSTLHRAEKKLAKKVSTNLFTPSGLLVVDIYLWGRRRRRGL